MDYKLVPILPVRSQVLMELLHNSPLKGKEFLFVGMVPLLRLIHHMASISDQMVSPIYLFLRQNSS